MKRKLLLLIGACIIAVNAHAQLGGCPSGTLPYQNDSATGTTQFTLTKLNSSGLAVIMATTDTTGYLGVAIQNSGTFGSVCVATSGQWPVRMDGTSTVQHYVQISGTTGGDGKDTGSASLPTSGGDIIGRVVAASTGGGAFSMVSMFPPEIQAVNPSGSGVTGPGSSAVNDCVAWNSTVGAVISDPATGICQIINGTIHAANTFFNASAFTSSSVTPSTVMISPSIAAGSTVGFTCYGLWSTGTAAGHNEMQINASQTPVSIWYALDNYRSATVNTVGASITNATLIDGGSNAVANNNEPWTLTGSIQWNASNPGTFTLQAATNITSATLTVVANAVCSINP